MALTPWNPFREMDELLARFQRGIRLPAAGGETEGWAPAVDISETEKEYAVRAELPSVKKEDVDIRVENGVLTLAGERKSEREDKDHKYHRIERSYGAYRRSFELPDDVQQDKISAECKDGVLTIHLPKAASKKSGPIQVKVE